MAPVLMLCAGGLVAGCHRPTPPEEPTAWPVESGDLDSLWDAALRVLAKHGFLPERQDRAMGLIETTPVTSQQWGEFWRQDVAGAYALAEASMHTIQRKAAVRFVHAPDGWQMEVCVDVYRLSTPESQVTTASSALQSFSGKLPTTEGETRLASRDTRRWVHLGRDGALEERLLLRILASAGLDGSGT